VTSLVSRYGSTVEIHNGAQDAKGHSTRCFPFYGGSWVCPCLSSVSIITNGPLFPRAATDDVPCSLPANSLKSKAGASSKLHMAHPQFVFLVGTEGPGHHLWSTLIENSPHFQALQKLALISQRLVTLHFNSFRNGICNIRSLLEPPAMASGTAPSW
jgi:hypothetical protein